MSSSTYRWNDAKCSSSKPYVCDIAPTTAAPAYVAQEPFDVVCDLIVRVTPTAASAALLAGNQLGNPQLTSTIGRRLNPHDWQSLPRVHITLSSTKYNSASYRGTNCMNNYNKYYGGTSCRTNTEDTPYLVVELEAGDVVSGVRIYFYSSAHYRSGTYQVFVADTHLGAAEGSSGNGVSCGSFTSPASTPWEHLSCPEGTSGRFVSIVLPGSSRMLWFSEVEVLGYATAPSPPPAPPSIESCTIQARGTIIAGRSVSTSSSCPHLNIEVTPAIATPIWRGCTVLVNGVRVINEPIPIGQKGGICAAHIDATTRELVGTQCWQTHLEAYSAVYFSRWVSRVPDGNIVAVTSCGSDWYSTAREGAVYGALQTIGLTQRRNDLSSGYPMALIGIKGGAALAEVDEAGMICTRGYEPAEGQDCLGWGSSLGSNIRGLSLTTCALRCSNAETCTSFEYSAAGGWCNINTCSASQEVPLSYGSTTTRVYGASATYMSAGMYSYDRQPSSHPASFCRRLPSVDTRNQNTWTLNTQLRCDEPALQFNPSSMIGAYTGDWGSASHVAAVAAVPTTASDLRLTDTNIADGEGSYWFSSRALDATLSIELEGLFLLHQVHINWVYAARSVLVLTSPTREGSADWEVAGSMKDAAGNRTGVETFQLHNSAARRVLIFVSTPVEASSPNGEPMLAISDIKFSACSPAAERSLLAAGRYSAAGISTLTSVSPRRGTTAGGTRITISGNFHIDNRQVSVSIAGVQCTSAKVASASGGRKITCITGYHGPTNATHSGSAYVLVTIEGVGGGTLAAATEATYSYIDLWSRSSTWGGDAPPIAGDVVIIPEGQSVVLDVSPPYIYMLVIQGHLTFDRVDLSLNTSYIFVQGGALTIGTEDEPFLQRATITLVGTPVSQELPLYGAKLIGCRDCTLDLHGKPEAVTWTRLTATLHPGDVDVCIAHTVDWAAFSEIVITTTTWSSNETETVIMAERQNPETGCFAVLPPGVQNEHLGIVKTYPGHARPVQLAASVGLLSRNLKIQGDDNSVFPNEYGVQMSMHSWGHESLIARIENIELFRAGQAFRLGRYPIRFHRIGTIRNSYVRHNSMHRLYNRAVVISSCHQLRVHGNVAYDIYGHAMFLETGAETKNEFVNNLVVSVRESVAMLNTDLTPAGFLIPNNDNIIRGNRVAGSWGYGFWLSPAEDGTTDDFGSTYCPHGTQLLDFTDNSASQCGMGGMIIQSNFNTNPLADVPPGSFAATRNPCYAAAPNNSYIPARMTNMLLWRNMRSGVKIMTGVAKLQMIGFQFVENDWTGLELPKRLFGPWGSNYMQGTLFVGGTGSQCAAPGGGRRRRCGKPQFGMRYAMYHRMEVRSATFADYYACGNLNGKETCSSAILGFPGCCMLKGSGGWETRFSDITWSNARYRVGWRWEQEGILVDVDGSFSGRPLPTDGQMLTVVGANSLLTNARVFPDCFEDLRYGAPKQGSCSSPYIPGLICPYTFVRVAVREASGDYSQKPLTISHGAVLPTPYEPGLQATVPFGTFVKSHDSVFLQHKWRPTGHTYLVDMDVTAAGDTLIPSHVYGGGQPTWQSATGRWNEDRSQILAEFTNRNGDVTSYNGTISANGEQIDWVLSSFVASTVPSWSLNPVGQTTCQVGTVATQSECGTATAILAAEESIAPGRNMQTGSSPNCGRNNQCGCEPLLLMRGMLPLPLCMLPPLRQLLPLPVLLLLQLLSRSTSRARVHHIQAIGLTLGR